MKARRTRSDFLELEEKAGVSSLLGALGTNLGPMKEQRIFNQTFLISPFRDFITFPHVDFMTLPSIWPFRSFLLHIKLFQNKDKPFPGTLMWDLSFGSVFRLDCFLHILHVLFFLDLSLFGSFSKFHFCLMFQKPILAKNRIFDSALTSLAKYQAYLK